MRLLSTHPDYPKPAKPWKKLTIQERSALYTLRARWRSAHNRQKYLDFASRVRSLRQALGLTQHQFARQMGVNWRSIARWEGAEGHLPHHINLHRLKELEELNAVLVSQHRMGDLRR